MYLLPFALLMAGVYGTTLDDMPIHPLLTRALQSGNPVIDGETATFLWQGRTAPRLIDDCHNWDEAPQEMTRLAPGSWGYSLSLPRGSYLEYAFLDPKTGARLPDPLNPRKIWNSINAHNHYFYMPEGGPTPLARPVKDSARGMVARREVETRNMAVGKKRAVYLYHPPTDEPVPLLVVFDGSDYLRQAKLNIIVDNLIAQKRIRPIAMALVQNAGQARMVEYGCADTTLGFVMESILPLAGEHLRLLPARDGAYGVLGASMGGLMALYTGLRLPGVFGRVLSQSGAFRIEGHEMVTGELVRHGPRHPINIWMDAGRFERLLEANNEMHALLEERGYGVTYHKFSGGHNYTAWRDDVWRGLEALFA